MTATTASTARPVAQATGRRRRRSLRFGALGLYLLLIVIAIVYVFPFLIEVATSFKTESDASADPLGLVPPSWTALAYRQLFVQSDFPLWFANSGIVTIAVTIGRTLFDSAAGYALARLEFRGRNALYAGLIAVMAVPGVVLLIPKFLVINQLGMFDSYSGMIIPLIADAAGVFIMKNFFESIPVAVEEAARLDGASTVRLFWSVILPMSRPALITIVILSFQGSWNELSHFIVSTSSPQLDTLTKGVASLAAGALGKANQYPRHLAAAAVMTIPVAVLFILFQRRITNTASGAVKE
ncbi:carbohydrate ABC transporter permease [Amnibacterium soli]|uniref:Carbohydrate ABC transporter permease n=1 Tax=Amnibacterium soli TaxID=1282736 RepID=A0ABP8YWY6_9MICO